MNDNENISVNSVVDEDWGEISLDDLSTEEETETEDTTGEETEEKADPEADQPTGGEDEEDHDDAGTAESFVLKHLGTEQTVGRDEVIALAQKGLDYSRIRDKLQTSETEKSAIAEKLSYFEKLADSQGKTLDQFIEATAAALRADEKKIPYEDALKEVQFEFEKSKFAKEKTDWEKSRSDTETEDNARQADIDAFMAKYPEAAAKPDSIPKEVWAEAEKTSLTEAYGNYIAKQKDAEIASLRKQLEQEKQYRKNKESSTGSQATDKSGAKDEFFETLWND